MICTIVLQMKTLLVIYGGHQLKRDSMIYILRCKDIENYHRCYTTSGSYYFTIANNEIRILEDERGDINAHANQKC
jgi:hypothetical protein